MGANFPRVCEGARRRFAERSNLLSCVSLFTETSRSLCFCDSLARDQTARGECREKRIARGLCLRCTLDSSEQRNLHVRVLRDHLERILNPLDLSWDRAPGVRGKRAAKCRLQRRCGPSARNRAAQRRGRAELLLCAGGATGGPGTFPSLFMLSSYFLACPLSFSSSCLDSVYLLEKVRHEHLIPVASGLHFDNHILLGLVLRAVLRRKLARGEQGKERKAEHCESQL